MFALLSPPLLHPLLSWSLHLIPNHLSHHLTTLNLQFAITLTPMCLLSYLKDLLIYLYVIIKELDWTQLSLTFSLISIISLLSCFPIFSTQNYLVEEPESRPNQSLSSIDPLLSPPVTIRRRFIHVKHFARPCGVNSSPISIDTLNITI